jgi:ABC-type phosphate transport system substrate-binding protein
LPHNFQYFVPKMLTKHSVVDLFIALFITKVSAQCGAGGFKIAGATVVQPIASAWSQNYGAQCKIPVVTDSPTGPANAIIVEAGGTTIGAGRVCGNAARGTTVDIGTMSRAWRDNEATTVDNWNYQCKLGDSTRSVIQLDVAVDAIAVIVKKGGIADSCVKLLGGGLTQDQVRWIFSSYTIAQLKMTGWKETALAKGSGSTDNLWNSLHKGCNPSEINIAGRELISGTTEYFRDKILKDAANGETFDDTGLRKFFTSTVDDVLMNYVANDASAIGFVGLVWYQSFTDKLNAIAIQNRAGEFIDPSADTLLSGEYNPLTRRTRMNLWKGSLAKTKPFMEYGYSPKGDSIVKELGIDPIPAAEQILMLSRLQSDRGVSLDQIECGQGAGVITAGGVLNLRPHLNIWSIHYMDKCPKVEVLLITTVAAQAIPRVCGNIAGKTTVATTNVKFQGTTSGNAYTFNCPSKPTSKLIELQLAPGPLYAYASNLPAEIAISRPFLRFALGSIGTRLLNLIGLTPSPEDVRTTMLSRIPATGGVTICFPGKSRVEVANKGLVAIKDLTLGDMVKVSRGKYSQIYSFGHYDRDVQASYLSIDTGLHSPLLISPDHMVFVNDRAKRASSITIGDKLSLADGYVVVRSVDTVTETGAFAPFTKDGTLIVDSIKVSSYVDLDDDSKLMSGSFSLFDMQWLAHLSQAPHRVICEVSKSFCSSESYNDGISVWVKHPHAFSKWLMQQNSYIVWAIFLPLFVFFGLFAILEVIIQNPALMLVLTLIMSLRKGKKTA